MVSATAVNAQKFGRVDLAAIVTNMTEFKEAQTNLEAYGRDLQDQLEQIQVEFNKLYADYEKNVATFSDTVRQLKERELTELQQRFQDFQQLAQQDMAKKEQTLMEPVQKKAIDAINEVAKAGGYTVVFETGSMIYFDEANVKDITPEVKTKVGIVAAQ
jgi:outer membrane protein